MILYLWYSCKVVKDPSPILLYLNKKKRHLTTWKTQEPFGNEVWCLKTHCRSWAIISARDAVNTFFYSLYSQTTLNYAARFKFTSAFKSCTLDCTVSTYKQLESKALKSSASVPCLKAYNHKADKNRTANLGSLNRSLKITTSRFSSLIVTNHVSIDHDIPPMFNLSSHIYSSSKM